MPINPKRILLIDADAGRRERLQAVLSEVNYMASAVSKMEEGLPVVSKSPHDLVVFSSVDHQDPAEKIKTLRKSLGPKHVPILLLAMGKTEKSGAERVLDNASPLDDILDSVEGLIGLPPPPATRPSETPKADHSAEIESVKKELEEMQEQVHFYEKQLAHVSMTGEKEAKEIDQVLRDLQETVDKSNLDRDQVREELRLLRADLAKKDREILEKESLIGNVRKELEREKVQLQHDLEDLKRVSEESKEQHKKAQSALREYYKAKTDKHSKTESSLKDLDAKLKESLAKYAEVQKDLFSKQKEIVVLKAEVETEKSKGKRAKEALSQLSKAFE